MGKNIMYYHAKIKTDVKLYVQVVTKNAIVITFAKNVKCFFMENGEKEKLKERGFCQKYDLPIKYGGFRLYKTRKCTEKNPTSSLS